MRISPDAAAKEALKSEETKAEPKPVVHGQGKVVSNTMFGDSLFGAKPAAGALGGNPFASPSSSGAANPFSTPSPAANPFSTSSSLAAKPPQTPSPTAAADLPQTFAAALTLNAAPPATSPPPPAAPWPPASDLPAPYPLLYLSDADYEILDKEAPLPPQKHQIMDLDEEPAGAAGVREDKDVYESSIDNTFQKFADRLSQNPEQVVRYEFRGQPLLYTKHDAVGQALGGGAGGAKVQTAARMPRCASCGAQRVFEVQMTPHAIAELESEEAGLEGMEWGTIIVGVCERDCQARGVGVGEVGYLEEWAGVQWEEVAERMRS